MAGSKPRLFASLPEEAPDDAATAGRKVRFGNENPTTKATLCLRAEADLTRKGVYYPN